jgi:hypothetical protein
MARKQSVIDLPMMHVSELAPIQPPPAELLPYWPLWRIKLGVEANHVVLGRSSVALWTHYILTGKRTIPCVKPFGEECPYCEKIEPRYNVYVACCRSIAQGPSILCLPSACAKVYPWLLDRQDLAGRVITGRKDGRSHRSHISLQLDDTEAIQLHPRAVISWQLLYRVLYNIWSVRLPAMFNSNKGDVA